MESPEEVLEFLEEHYHVMPMFWQHIPEDDFDSILTKAEIKKMHTVFLYCISPIVFKQQYLDSDLNDFASFAGLRPCGGRGEIFEPEKHSEENELFCFEMVTFAHQVVRFMFKLLREDQLPAIACKVFRYGMDARVCMAEARRICDELLDGRITGKNFVAMFTITLAVVSDSERCDIIVDRFNFVQLNAESDCLRLAEQAKDFVTKSNFDAAIALYKQSIAFRPFDHKTYSNLAQIYLKTKKFQFAQWCAQRAVWIDPSWPKSHYRYIQALDCQGLTHSAWSLSSAVVQLSELNSGCFTGGKELLKDLVKQRDNLSQKALNMQVSNIIHEGTKMHSTKRSKRKCTSNALTDCPPNIALSQKKSSADKDKKSEVISESTKEITLDSKEVKIIPMPKVPEMSTPNADMQNGQIKSSSSVNSANKTKSEKHVPNEENIFLTNNNKVVKIKLVNIQNYIKYTHEGSEALIMQSFKVAFQKYTLALGVLQSKGAKALGISEISVIVLKYCYARACIGKGTNEDIELGLKTLDEIINDHFTISFPLAYYGKVLGFIAQNRYKEARDPLEKLSSIIANKIKSEVYEYPNCESKIIEESHPEKLQKCTENLLSICNAPPAPNAICRHVTDDCNHRCEIYYSDPDFQGFTQLICHERCYLQYHMNCWKEIKDRKNFPFEKDFLSKPCFTPDCHSTILKVELFGADGMKRKTFPSEEEIAKPKLKDPLPAKVPAPKVLNKKGAKVSNKKERTPVTEQMSDKLSVHRQSDSSNEEKIHNYLTIVADTRQNAIMVLKKNKTEDVNAAVERKKQQKKVKVKESLPFDFTTSDCSRIEQLKSIRNAAERDDNLFKFPWQFRLDPENPFALPQNAQNNTENTEKWLLESFYRQNSVPIKDEVEENLLEYIESYVKANGPTSIVSTEFVSEVAAFPPEVNKLCEKYGGIRGLLLSKPKKFFMLKDYVLLPKQYLLLPSDSLTRALDLALKGCDLKRSLYNNETNPNMVRWFSSGALNYNTTSDKLTEIPLYIRVMNAVKRSKLSTVKMNPPYGAYNGQLAAPNFKNCAYNLRNEHLSDSEDSSSELSSSDEVEEENEGIHASESSNCDSVLKQVSQPTSDFDKASMPVSNAMPPLRNGSVNMGRIMKTSISTSCDDDFMDNCISCIKYAAELEKLKVKHTKTSEECLELKDKLTQAQNELQVTKKVAKRENDDLREEAKKIEKQYNFIQTNNNSNNKKAEAEKRKLNTEIRALNEKISALSFEKDKLTSEQSKLDKTVSLKHNLLEEEKRQRFKAEEEIEVLKSSLDVMEVNYKQALTEKLELIDKVKAQEAQIRSLINKAAVAEAKLERRPLLPNAMVRPPPMFYPMDQQGRPIQPPFNPMVMHERYPPQHLVMQGNYQKHVMRNGGFFPNPPVYPRMMPPNILHEPYKQFPAYEMQSTNTSNGVIRPPTGNPSVINTTQPSTSFEKLSNSNSPIHQSVAFPLKNIAIPDNAAKQEATPNIHNESFDSEYSFPKTSPVANKLSDQAIENQEKQSSRSSILHQILRKEFPTIKKNTLSKYIAKVRAKHNNRLTGTQISVIVQEIRNAIFEDHLSKGAIPKDGTRRLLDNPSKANTMGLEKFTEVPFTWGINAEFVGEHKQYNGNEDECYICYEDMDISDLHSLSCGHAYHRNCIMRWFEVDNTCPTCRLYAPLEEEFPKLN